MMFAIVSMIFGFICMALERYPNAFLSFGFAFIYSCVTVAYEIKEKKQKRSGK